MELLYELNTIAKPVGKINEVVYKRTLQKPQFEKDTGIEPELLWALLWGNGYTVKYIGKLFSCGQTTIREGMRQYGIPCPGYSHYDERLVSDAIIECNRRRRLKEKTLLEVFTNEEWLEKVKSTNSICPACGHPYEEGGGLTLDHILPVSKAPIGFRYTIDDVSPICRSCNSTKSDNVQPKHLNIIKPYHIYVNRNKTDTLIKMSAGGEERGETFLGEVVSSSRITIPKPVRRKLNIVEGDEVYVRIWKEKEPKQEVGTKDRFTRK